MRRGRRGAWPALVALAAVLGGATSAPALIITGGPVYSLPGGGSCSVSGEPGRGSGATITCSGVVLGAHSNTYFGIKNDTNANGNTMTGVSPSGAAVFGFSTSGASSITYTSSTTLNNQLGSATQAVSNTLVLTLTGGSASVVDTSGNPAGNGNGAITKLFKLNSGTGFTFTAVISSSTSGVVSNVPSDPGPRSGVANPGVYDPYHTPATGTSDFAKVDLGFYYSNCGDGVVDSPEQCDLGGSNGGAPSCCSSSCTYNSAATVCRGAAGTCDLQETCTGASAACPADTKSTATCRGSVGTCDVAEVCPGNSNTCPADSFAPSSTVCRNSGGVCDPQETCTGTSNACPADAKSTSQCRASGGVCDPAEVCDGVGVNCPADAKSTSTCRASVGVCDVAEVCDGTNNNCPTDAFASSSTV
jgi:hypothetical protein